MKSILLLLLSVVFCLPLGAAEESDKPIPRFPYLRTSVVKMSKGAKTVRIMVWAKNIPLTMKAYKSPSDRRPKVQKVAKGKTLDIEFAATNKYRVEVLWEGKVIMKQSAGSKSGL